MSVWLRSKNSFFFKDSSDLFYAFKALFHKIVGFGCISYVYLGSVNFQKYLVIS